MQRLHIEHFEPNRQDQYDLCIIKCIKFILSFNNFKLQIKCQPAERILNKSHIFKASPVQIHLTQVHKRASE